MSTTSHKFMPTERSMAHGTSTILEKIDRLAYSIPDATWIQFAASGDDLRKGHMTSITFSGLANAINRLAWFLASKFHDTQDFSTTISYLGPSDIRYFILVCAACKCRIRTLLSSPRNTVAAHKSLFDSTQCRTLVGPKESCKDLLVACKMDHIEIPTLQEVLYGDKVDEYPWSKSFAEVAHEPFVILHTSGSTGFPKPVEVSHALVATIDAQQDLPPVEGRYISPHLWANRSVYSALPLFHSAAFNLLAYSIFQGTQLVIGPPDGPPSVSTVESVLDMEIATAGIMAPSLLAEIASEPDVLRKLSRWDTVAFGGGPLSQDVGEQICSYTKPVPMLGSTETFNLPEFVPETKDELQYHAYHPSLGITFRQVSENLHELVFVRNSERLKHQGAFATFPDLDEYPMKDLYEKHPTKDGLWSYKGRLDDIIVLSNGEKFNPGEAEQILSTHDDIKSAIIVGTGQEQTAVLLEPEMSDTSDDIESPNLDTEIARANEVLPAYAKIHTTHVRMVHSSSFSRSTKGGVQRAKTVEMLHDEIVDVYASADGAGASASSVDFSTRESLVQSLSSIITSDILPGQILTPEDDIFVRGVDSLGVLRLLRVLKTNMRAREMKCVSQISARTIYNGRTVSSLAASLTNLVNGVEQEPSHGLDNSQMRMEQMLESFMARLPTAASANESDASRQVFLLTGTTGSLGSYLLNALLKCSPSAKIICLNRPGGDACKQAKIQQSRELSDNFSRVEFMECNIAEHNLGLNQASYDRLLGVTHIIHNAWPVNFNLPLTDFEDQLQACCSLISLANTSHNRATLTFLSSVGAANYWAEAGNDDPVPETKLVDFSVAESSGYAQSKFLAEHLFAAANERLGLAVNVCRIGQIAGPVCSNKGMWNLQEWFPSMLMTSKMIGRLPDNLAAMDRIDWIPVDLLADILVDAIQDGTTPSENRTSGPNDAIDDFTRVPALRSSSGSQNSRSTSQSSSPDRYSTPASSTSSVMAAEDTKALLRFMHFVNPHAVYWRDLASSVARTLGDEIQLVSFDAWKNEISASIESDDGLGGSHLPAAKLEGFFQDIGTDGARRPIFSVKNTAATSDKLRKLQAVSIDWLSQWLGQWFMSTNV